jgi:hypothetical protein
MHNVRLRARLFSAVLFVSFGTFALHVEAALTVYSTKAAFLAATGSPTLESFETLPDRAFSHSPIGTPGFTMTPVTSQIELRSSPTGGHYPTDGVKYVQFGDPNLGPAGALRFDLAQPAKRFALSITDWGDANAGTLTIQTNAGDSITPILIATNPPRVGSGQLIFFGLEQDVAFTSVTLSSSSASDGMGIDEIYTSATPEPSAVAIFVVAGWCTLVRRRVKVSH